MKTKKAIELVKEAAPLVATFRAVLEDKIAVDPKIERTYDNCDRWLKEVYKKLTKEGVEI